MFQDKPILLKSQSKELVDEKAYYSNNKMLSFSSFKSMLDCPSNYLLGEKQDWDKTEFLIGHGAEKFALEGQGAFEKWLTHGKKDGAPISDVALKQPSKKSMEEYEKLLIAQSWLRAKKFVADHENEDPLTMTDDLIDKFHDAKDWKLKNGKKPTSSQVKAMEKLLDEHGEKTPEMPKPTQAAWVEKAKTCGIMSRKVCPWLVDLVNHPDTKLQHAICVEYMGIKWKMRLDLVNPTLGIILDYKTVGYKLDRNGWKVVKDESGRPRNVRVNFVEDQQYLLQAAIYTMGCYAEFDGIFNYYIAACEKNELPRFELLEIPLEDRAEAFELVNSKQNLMDAQLNGMKPDECGLHSCKYCSPRRNITEAIDWREV